MCPVNPQKNIEERNSVLFAILFAGLVFALAMRPIEAFDTFWQLQSGKYIWQTGQFIYKDTFSQFAETFRLEHCWLHDVVLYVFFSVGGYSMLSILKPAIIAICGFLLIWRHFKITGDYVVSTLVVMFCIIGSEPSWLVRPQLWTMLFSLLYLLILFSGRTIGWRRWFWLIPIMLFWANMHAGCVFGLVMIGLFGVGELWRILLKRQSWRRFLELTVVGLLTFAASFVNPYGYKIPLPTLMHHMKQHRVLSGEASVGMLGNMEWLPPSFELVPIFYLVMCFWGLLVLLRIRKLDPAEGIFYLAFLYMGINQVRHTTLVALLAGFFLPLAIKDVLDLCQTIKIIPREYARGTIVIGLTVTIIYFVSPFVGKTWGLGLKEKEYPIAASEFIDEKKLPTQLYNSYDWGGYLMWKLYPRYLVFVDGRTNDKKVLSQASVIDAADRGWQKHLDENKVNTIISRTCFYDTGEPVNLVFQLADADDWQLVFADDVALVFVRRDMMPKGVKPLDKSLAYNSMYLEARRLYEEDSLRSKAHISMTLAALKLGRQEEARKIFETHIQGTELLPSFNRYIGRSR